MLEGRSALVTGASRGIGAAVARIFAAAGARVAVTARSGDALTDVAGDLGDGHLAVVADLTIADDVRTLTERTQAWANGAPDIVINNAGAFPRASAHQQDPDEFVRTVELNLSTPFRLIRAFLPAMRARGSGTLVTVGSVADRHAFAMNAAYSASKYGARALHEVIRAETRGTGVRASLVSPGPVDTAIWDAHEAALGASLPRRTAMLRAEDVARAILFVVTQPRDVTIEELRVAFS